MRVDYSCFFFVFLQGYIQHDRRTDKNVVYSMVVIFTGIYTTDDRRWKYRICVCFPFIRAGTISLIYTKVNFLVF